MTGTLKRLKSMPTLKDVARLAGVGRGTASRALSGQGYVSERSAARVHAVAKQLGYQRNELARNLKMKRSGAIGLVVPDIGGPFMISCIRAIQRVLQEHEYIPIIVFTDGKEDAERAEIEYLMRHQVEGIIIVPANSSGAHFRSPQVARIPLVAFDQPALRGDYDAVLVDNRRSARAAVRHLIDHGHERIACLGVNHHLHSIQKRIEGYRDAMRRARLPVTLKVVDPEYDALGSQLDRWLALSEPPTAIFSLNELTSVGLMQAFSVRNIRMPDGMAFVGFDDIQLGPYLDPPLTVVLQPATKIGEVTAARLLERIQAKNVMPAKRIQLEADLILRGSCGCNWAPRL